jgi:NAD(P)-dependent dehydrogenase (short-subunit alcohol dehydrogenase family)
LPLDLASLDAVKQAAATFLAQADRLDILVLNAGVMCIRKLDPTARQIRHLQARSHPRKENDD